MRDFPPTPKAQAYPPLIDVSHTDSGMTFTSQVYFDGQVYRWSSNDAVPPVECNANYGIERLPHFSAAAQAAVRDMDTQAFLSAYRAQQAQAGPPSVEEMAEMRAAFGSGTEVVNVVTGRRTQL